MADGCFIEHSSQIMVSYGNNVYFRKNLSAMKRFVIYILLLTFAVNAAGQDKIKWHSIEEAIQLASTDPRVLVIDVYTDWCGWCKKMDQDTFTNPVIAEILNTKFYPVKFNAEGNEEITFLGQKFTNDGQAGKAHQLAVALLNGRLSYPTVVFLTKQGDKFQVSPVPGYRQPKEMEMLLSFFADKAFETSSFQDFSAAFKGKIE